MTRWIGLVLWTLAAALVAVASASAAQPQEIRIGSILYGVPADPANPNLFAISGCFAVSGAVNDRGGDPQFDALGAVVGCGSPAGIAGYAQFDGLGHLKSGSPNVLEAQHTMFGQHGSIQIKFEGKYGPISLVGGRRVAATGPGEAWQITCGAGAYAGLQGTGTDYAVADFTDAFTGVGPVVVSHTETGQVHETGSAGCGS